MARLAFFGAETGHVHAEGLGSAVGSPTYSTSVFRSGARSFAHTSSTTQVYNLATISAATGTTYYFSMWFQVNALPSTGSPWIIDVQDAGVSINAVKVVLTSGGKIQLQDQAGTQIGSDSAATIAANTWYHVELAVRIGAGATDYAECWLDGTSVASTSTGNFMDVAPTRWLFGWVANKAGLSRTIYVDDVIINDSTGSANTGRPLRNERVILLPLVSDNSLGNWTAGAGSTSNLWAALDNIPPAGVSVASATNTSQIKNTVSAAGNAYDGNAQTYTDAGIGSEDTITALFAVMEGSSNSTTGTDTATITGVSNPAITGVSGSVDVSAGTYPTSWNRTATAIVNNPSVTLGTNPVLRVAKDVATTRGNTVCLLALMVSYADAFGVAPPVATATGTALVPTLPGIGAVLIDVPTATATAAALVPTLRATAAPPVATSTATAPTPTLRDTLPIPLATASASALTPTLRATATPPAASATGAASAPALTILTPAATASADAIAPAVQIGTANVTIAPPVAAATADALAPTMRATAQPPVAMVSGTGLPPTLRATLTAPSASATAATATPTLAENLGTPAATGTGTANTPALTILPPMGTATATAPTPALSMPLVVPLATATAAAIAPVLRASIASPIATATASALAPGLPLPLAVPLATATGTALAPALHETVSPPVAASSGAALPPLLALPLPLATATGATLTPTLRAMVAAPVATANGQGETPAIPALGSIVISPPLATATGTAPVPILAAALGAPTGTAAGAGLPPASLAVVTPAASGTAIAAVPAVRDTVAVPLVTATGTAAAPVLRLVIATPTATGSAGTVASALDVLVPIATGSGQAAPPILVTAIGAPVAGASGQAGTPAVVVPGLAGLSAHLTMERVLAASLALGDIIDGGITTRAALAAVLSTQ